MSNRPTTNGHPVWATSHAQRVRSIENPSKDDALLLLLYDKPDRTLAEDRTLRALFRVERAKETVRAARGTIRQATSAAAKTERKDRDHERYLASGLLTMVGLLDGQTGKPTWDRAILLGALDALAKVDASEDQKRRWKARGDVMLDKTGDDAKNPSGTV